MNAHILNWRRLIFWRQGQLCAMTSMGGVGSTALARHIGSVADKTVYEHAFSPSVYDHYGEIRLGYMFGNPYNSVLSVFRRGYQQMHVKAMNANSGTPPADLHKMSLEAYLERGVDEFHIERQFNNWTNQQQPKHPALLIKYETLADNLEEVLAFFDCKRPFKVKPRRSAWQDQPAHIREGLERIYGGLAARIEASPGIQILSPGKDLTSLKHSAS